MGSKQRLGVSQRPQTAPDPFSERVGIIARAEAELQRQRLFVRLGAAAVAEGAMRAAAVRPVLPLPPGLTRADAIREARPFLTILDTTVGLENAEFVKNNIDFWTPLKYQVKPPVLVTDYLIRSSLEEKRILLLGELTRFEPQIVALGLASREEVLALPPLKEVVPDSFIAKAVEVAQLIQLAHAPQFEAEREGVLINFKITEGLKLAKELSKGVNLESVTPRALALAKLLESRVSALPLQAPGPATPDVELGGGEAEGGQIAPKALTPPMWLRDP